MQNLCPEKKKLFLKLYVRLVQQWHEGWDIGSDLRNKLRKIKIIWNPLLGTWMEVMTINIAHLIIVIQGITKSFEVIEKLPSLKTQEKKILLWMCTKPWRNFSWPGQKWGRGYLYTPLQTPRT
jgi:hypothetical protein